MNNTPQSNPDDPQKQQAIVELMRKLEYLDENCYSCEEAFALIDEYVELIASEEEVERIMPLVKNHLDKCSHCKEAYLMLMQIIQSEPSES